MKLEVYLLTPVLVLPFKNDGNFNNECWVINLGNLNVKTSDEVLKPNLSLHESSIDKYDIKLEEIKFEVFYLY